MSVTLGNVIFQLHRPRSQRSNLVKRTFSSAVCHKTLRHKLQERYNTRQRSKYYQNQSSGKTAVRNLNPKRFESKHVILNCHVIRKIISRDPKKCFLLNAMTANALFKNHVTTFLCHVTTSFADHVISFYWSPYLKILTADLPL